MDICPEYNPSKLMLEGEPYLMDYKVHIDDDLSDAKKEVIKEGHVNLWTISL